MLSIGDRMNDVEKRLSALEANVKVKLDAIECNTRELLGAFTFTKNLSGYIGKYGPKALTFGAGLMTAAGVGNPAIWHYVGSFFS